MDLFSLLLPELILVAAALVLFLFGVVKSPAGRRVVPFVALLALAGAMAVVFFSPERPSGATADWTGAVGVSAFSTYARVLTLGVGAFFVLLSWPTNADATGNPALRFGSDAGEYFGLILLSLCGIMIVASANDTMLLFMGIELASIPTYVLVSTSRPLPAAQEAGVKYFYLGAMTAAVLLFGFAYLYGATGTTSLHESGRVFAGQLPGLGVNSPAAAVFDPTTWQVMGVTFVILGLCFKLAAVPLHFYAGDVYVGAATPVTALLSFVPKTVGILAMVKVLYAVGGNNFALPPAVWKTLMVVAVLTMFFGNALALLANNVKRVMAYSSISHSGYMLVALVALAASAPVRGEVGGAGGAGGARLFAGGGVADKAVAGVLFYLAAYGIMNAGVFGVLMMLPTRRRVTDRAGNPRTLPATSAETYDDLAGAGRRHPLLAAAMAVCCISLIGIPLTAGFLGKFYILQPAIDLATRDATGAAGRTAMRWLIGLTAVNFAIGAAYYLKIVVAMVLTPSPEQEEAEAEGGVYEPGKPPRQPLPLVLATGLSVAGVLLFGGILPAGINWLGGAAAQAAGAVRDVAVRDVAVRPISPETAARPFPNEAVAGVAGVPTPPAPAGPLGDAPPPAPPQ